MVLKCLKINWEIKRSFGPIKYIKLTSDLNKEGQANQYNVRNQKKRFKLLALFELFKYDYL